MDILHFSTYHKSAGQSIAANRLHSGLLDRGIRSDMVVSPYRHIYTPDITVHLADNRPGHPFGSANDKKYIAEYPNRDTSDNFCPALAGIDIVHEVSKFEPDIIQLHFINDGFVRLESLVDLKQPIVWRLSDCWALTGGCHFANVCEAYKTGCGDCPLLKSKTHPDISAEVWKRKQRIYGELEYRMFFVTPSKWLYNKCKTSPLLGGKQVFNIPNGLDTTSEFYPIDKYAARAVLGLPSDKKIVLFGAENPTNRRKGLDLLTSALERLTDKKGYHFVAFGHLRPKDMQVAGLEFTCFGPTYDTEQLRRLYSAADVFVCPSRVEPFGQVVTESMACGTPVVAFANTGPGTIVEHKVTGYVAEYMDIEELAKGVEYCTTHNMTAAARKSAVEVYDINVIVSQYVAMYDNILNK